MKTIQVTCAYCNQPKMVRVAEYNRQTRLGRKLWFCTLSHAAMFFNESKKNRPILKTCPCCKTTFQTVEGKHERTYCSASCATKATVSNEARRRGGLNSVHDVYTAARTLKSREAFKYVNVEKALNDRNIRHEFEMPIGDKVFDLVLTDERICVEFDGPNHRLKKEQERDKIKTETAEKHGYKVVRVQCGRMEIIDPTAVFKLI